MLSNIEIGQKVRVTVRFVDYDFYAGTDELLGPTSVSAALYKYNNTTTVWDLVQNDLGPIVNTSLGIYYYDWTPTENGRFRLLFLGTLLGATPSTIENPRDFYIGTAEPTITLGSTEEFMFLGGLDPLYLDPELILNFYTPEDMQNGLVEITEIIYRISSELQDWFGESLILTTKMEEYVLAATLCELTKIHTYNGGMDGFANVSSFTLGDLQVKDGGDGGSSSKAPNRGNATTWCELANLLRDELIANRGVPKTYVRGSIYPNPIPSRALRSFEPRSLRRSG
jgi:hypothetical protein